MNKLTIELPDSRDSFDTPRWPGKYLCLYREVTESRRYILCTPLTFITDSGLIITAKPGFITDGASVPRLFWFYASPFAGPHAPAVVIHDILYAAHYGRREDSDRIFYEALLSLPMRNSKAWLMYKSVRAGGSSAWEEKTKTQIQKTQKLLDVREFLGDK